MSPIKTTSEDKIIPEGIDGTPQSLTKTKGLHHSLPKTQTNRDLSKDDGKGSENVNATIALDPLYIFERTKTCTDLPFVYMEPAEPCKFLKCKKYCNL